MGRGGGGAANESKDGLGDADGVLELLQAQGGAVGATNGTTLQRAQGPPSELGRGTRAAQQKTNAQPNQPPGSHT